MKFKKIAALVIAFAMVLTSVFSGIGALAAETESNGIGTLQTSANTTDFSTEFLYTADENSSASVNFDVNNQTTTPVFTEDFEEYDVDTVVTGTNDAKVTVGINEGNKVGNLSSYWEGGTYRPYDAGSYQADFYLKIDGYEWIAHRIILKDNIFLYTKGSFDEANKAYDGKFYLYAGNTDFDTNGGPNENHILLAETSYLDIAAGRYYRVVVTENHVTLYSAINSDFSDISKEINCDIPKKYCDTTGILEFSNNNTGGYLDNISIIDLTAENNVAPEVDDIVKDVDFSDFVKSLPFENSKLDTDNALRAEIGNSSWQTSQLFDSISDDYTLEWKIRTSSEAWNQFSINLGRDSNDRNWYVHFRGWELLNDTHSDGTAQYPDNIRDYSAFICNSQDAELGYKAYHVFTEKDAGGTRICPANYDIWMKAEVKSNKISVWLSQNRDYSDAAQMFYDITDAEINNKYLSLYRGSESVFVDDMSITLADGTSFFNSDFSDYLVAPFNYSKVDFSKGENDPMANLYGDGGISPETIIFDNLSGEYIAQWYMDTSNWVWDDFKISLRNDYYISLKGENHSGFNDGTNNRNGAFIHKGDWQEVNRVGYMFPETGPGKIPADGIWMKAEVKYDGIKVWFSADGNYAQEPTMHYPVSDDSLYGHSDLKIWRYDQSMLMDDLLITRLDGTVLYENDFSEYIKNCYYKENIAINANGQYQGVQDGKDTWASYGIFATPKNFEAVFWMNPGHWQWQDSTISINDIQLDIKGQANSGIDNTQAWWLKFNDIQVSYSLGGVDGSKTDEPCWIKMSNNNGVVKVYRNHYEASFSEENLILELNIDASQVQAGEFKIKKGGEQLLVDNITVRDLDTPVYKKLALNGTNIQVLGINSGNKTVLSSYDGLTAGKTYRIALVRKNGEINVYVDDKLIEELTVNASGDGKVYADNTGAVAFDSFDVERIENAYRFDVDGDDCFNATDLTAMRKILLKAIEEFDVNRDSNCNIIDLVVLKKCLIYSESDTIYVSSEGSDYMPGFSPEYALNKLNSAIRKLNNGGNISIVGTCTVDDINLFSSEGLITISGGTLDLTGISQLNLNSNLKLENLTVKASDNLVIYANGYDFTVDDTVTFDGEIAAVYGGSKKK